MQKRLRLHYQMIFDEFSKFPNITQPSGVIALMAVCHTFHTSSRPHI